MTFNSGGSYSLLKLSRRSRDRSLAASFEISRNRLDAYSSALHSSLQSCSAFLPRGSQLSRANSWAHAELFSIDMLSGISDRVKDGRGGKSGGSSRSRGCCQALVRTSPLDSRFWNNQACSDKSLIVGCSPESGL